MRLAGGKRGGPEWPSGANNRRATASNVRRGSRAGLSRNDALTGAGAPQKGVPMSEQPPKQHDPHTGGSDQRTISDRRAAAEPDVHKQRAEQLAARLNGLVAEVAHELRNPLAALAGSIDLLAPLAATRPDTARAQAIAEQQLADLNRLLDDLLDVTQLTSGNRPLRPTPTDLIEPVRRAVEQVTPALQARRQTITIATPVAAVPVDVDPERMVVALAAALRATGAATMVGAALEAAVRSQHHEATVVVSGPTETTAGTAWTPIPTIAVEIISRHRGKVAWERHGQRERRLVVRLPLAASTAPSTAPSIAAPRTARALGARRSTGANADVSRPATGTAPARRTLVVEDNPDVAEVLTELLGEMGHEVHLARSGEEAIRCFTEFSPDLVLIDIGLPDLSGHDVARAIRAAPTGSTVTLVAVTGWGSEDDRQRSAEAGIDYHLVKPLTRYQLAWLTGAKISDDRPGTATLRSRAGSGPGLAGGGPTGGSSPPWSRRKGG